MARDQMIHGDHDLGDPSILYRQPYLFRRSPIVVTIADPKMTPVDLQKMMEAGMNVMKFETSRCTKEEKIHLLSKVNKASSNLCKKYGVQNWPCATCLELKTCIVKTGIVEGKENFVTIKEGSKLTLTYDLDAFDKCNTSQIFVDNPYIGVDAEIGMIIILSEGEVEMRCIKIIDTRSILCLVIKTGNLTNMNVVNVRGGKRTRPVLEKKDLQIIKFALDFQVELLIINYARRAETLRKVKEYMGAKNRRPVILAGICSKEGILNVDEIIKAGKPFYISGDLFNQALSNGEFVDSESADVTNALLDGVSGFILKDCHSIEMLLDVIRALDQLCCTVEPLTNRKTDFWRILEGKAVPNTAAQACAVSCAALAHQNNAKVIIIPTVTGDTAKILMWLRPASLVLTVSSNPFTTRRLLSYRCVVPLMFKGAGQKDWEKTIKARVKYAVQYAVKMGWLDFKDSYVTLQRGAYSSAFCDTVRTWNVTTGSNTAWIECPDETEPQVEKKYDDYFDDVDI